MVQTPFHVYLVGGAVRDQLLNLPVKDRDWVIVGATPQTLIDLGYQQVGKDFPVFLHPQSKEEYALARTERKSGQGYTGFIWQHENNVVIGYGGDRYTRSDVVKLLKLKDTFEPYIDTFSRGALDVNGNPAATAEEVRHGLMQILSDLERHLGSEQQNHHVEL